MILSPALDCGAKTLANSSADLSIVLQFVSDESCVFASKDASAPSHPAAPNIRQRNMEKNGIPYLVAPA